ncbi:MAG: acyl carrier protein [Prolixibacteraceae bacterium]
MKEKRIRRNLYRVLRKTGVQKKDIQTEASYDEDLNFDSVDWKIFMFYLEGIFNISVRDEEVSKFCNVNDTIFYLKNTS